MSKRTPPKYQPPSAAEIVIGAMVFGGFLLWNWWPA